MYDINIVVIPSPSYVQLFATPWTAACQAPLSLTISGSWPKFMTIASVMPASHLILWCPLLLLPTVFPRIRDLFQWLSCSHQVTEILEFQLKHQSFQWIFRVDFPKDWLVWSPCCPKDSQESSPAPQFEGSNYLALFLLYGPALTAIHDHSEDHSLDYVNLCQQNIISAFQHTVWS